MNLINRTNIVWLVSHPVAQVAAVAFLAFAYIVYKLNGIFSILTSMQPHMGSLSTKLDVTTSEVSITSKLGLLGVQLESLGEKVALLNNHVDQLKSKSTELDAKSGQLAQSFKDVMLIFEANHKELNKLTNEIFSESNRVIQSMESSLINIARNNNIVARFCMKAQEIIANKSDNKAKIHDLWTCYDDFQMDTFSTFEAYQTLYEAIDDLNIAVAADFYVDKNNNYLSNKSVDEITKKLAAILGNEGDNKFVFLLNAIKLTQQDNEFSTWVQDKKQVEAQPASQPSATDGQKEAPILETQQASQSAKTSSDITITAAISTSVSGQAPSITIPLPSATSSSTSVSTNSPTSTNPLKELSTDPLSSASS